MNPGGLIRGLFVEIFDNGFVIREIWPPEVRESSRHDDFSDRCSRLGLAGDRGL